MSRALLLGVKQRAPDFWKLPFGSAAMASSVRAEPVGAEEDDFMLGSFLSQWENFKLSWLPYQIYIYAYGHICIHTLPRCV